MKISAVRNVNFTNQQRSVLPQKQPSDSISSKNTTTQQNINSIYKTTGAAIAGLSVVGAGIYFIHRKNLKTARKLFHQLPDTPLANSLPQNIRKELSYSDKYQKFLKFLFNPPEENLAGKGANSKVYNIPFLDKYVLKVLKPKSYYKPLEVPLNIFPDDVNLGQPVWVHPENYRLILLKKISGEPHSIKNWSSTIWDEKIRDAVPVTKEQAHQYYTQVTRIAGMEQSVFDDLALQIKTLDDAVNIEYGVPHGFKTDSINPNNLMVDYEKNKLSVIDYFTKTKPQHQNSYLDMVSVITDFTLFHEYYDLLGANEQKKLLQAIKQIDKKSFAAAVKIGLDTDENTFINFINYTNKYFHVPGVPKPDGNGEYIRQYGHSTGNMLSLLKHLRNQHEFS